MTAKPLMLVVEGKAVWFALVAKIGREFKLERALCEAGALAFCPTEIKEKRASGHAKRVERRTQHPQMPPYVFVMSFGAFPWWILKDREITRHLHGYLGAEEGETYVPVAIPWKGEDGMERLMQQGYNLPADRQIMAVRRNRRAKRIRKLMRMAA